LALARTDYLKQDKFDEIVPLWANRVGLAKPLDWSHSDRNCWYI
jgi:hypothetical protein